MKCNYCKRKSRYSLNFYGSEVTEIQACEQHKYQGFAEQQSVSLKEELKDMARYYRERFNRPLTVFHLSDNP